MSYVKILTHMVEMNQANLRLMVVIKREDLSFNITKCRLYYGYYCIVNLEPDHHDLATHYH